MHRPQNIFAKLSPKPQPQLGAEMAIFPINPTTHPGKFKIDLKQFLDL